MKKIYTFILMLGLAQQPVFSQYGEFTFNFSFNFDLSNMDLSNTDLNLNINLGNNFNFGDFDFSNIYAGDPCPYCPDETIGNFSFTTSSSFDTAIANEALWERARKAAKRDWFNKQKELIKKNIEEKLNTSFPNYDAAKNALFLHSEQGNIRRNSAVPKSKYGNLESRGYSATRGYLKGLKLIQLRRAEINAGNINNSQYGYLTIDSTPLKDIRDLTTLNQKWSKIAFPMEANISDTHRYKYIRQRLNNLGAGFDREIIAQKNSFYAGFNEWKQLNYMQFLINFEEIKRVTALPIYIPELEQFFNEFKGTDKATTPVIETYAINHRGGGNSIFASSYCTRTIRAGREWVTIEIPGCIEARRNTLNNLLNNTSTADFAINNLIAELNITEANQKSWLFAHRSEASLIDAFLDENRVNGVATIEIKSLATIAINSFIDDTNTTYPGSDSSLPNNWWLDNDFIVNSGNFNIDDETPNAKEVALFAIFRKEAILHIENSTTALNKAEELVTNGTLTGLGDGKADAFRHAYWNALGTAEFGSNMMKLFADAHEWGETPSNSVTMDFYNNHKGRILGEAFNFFSSDSEIANAILQAVYDGVLKYINNLGQLVFTNQ